MATISRLYKDYDTGARVVAELEHFGIPQTEISIIANNETGWFDRNRSTRIDRDADGTDDRAEGAAAGAGIGGTIGGVAGLLAGLGLLAIPGIGPVVAAGWLASTAAVAVAGGAAGGLIGALTQSGMREPEARNYAEGVRRGGTLVTVRVRDTDRMQVEAIMDRHNPMDTKGIGAEDRTGSWRDDRIVAAFQNADQTRSARQALIAAGIDNANMDVLENRSDLDNWTAIKQHAVPDEDAHLYAEGLGRGHSLLVIRGVAGEYDRIIQLLTRFNPIDIDEHAARWRTAGWSGVHTGKTAWDARQQTSAAPKTATGTPETREEVIPVYEERLKVGKRVVEQGHVRVRVYTVDHPAQEGVTLREERVAVERRPADRSASSVSSEAFKDRTIDVTTHREEPVTAKETQLKEEVVVRRDADQRAATVRDTVRRTEVEVDDDRAKARAPASPSATPPAK
jgi:uncharacterized protein (TIGR02271 family)